MLTTLGAAALESVRPGAERLPILGPGKPLALLVYLAASPGRSATREHLIDLLWADLELDAARHALRQTLWYLRQRLGPDTIAARGGSVSLCAPVESDRDAFLEAVDQLDFERAVELYTGDFLPVFAAPGGADFEHWADHERYRLRSLFLRAAESLVRDWLSKGHAARAKELAGRARDADPKDESAWRLLLEALLAANDRVAAELEADALERQLAEAELPPEPATRSLVARVRETPAEPEAEAPRRALVADLIGREREFSTIVSAWRAARSGEGRHVHLTGAAGLGKTRLLNDVYARLRAMGARAVQVRANPGERQVPYAFASDLAAALARLPGATVISQGGAGALVALNPSLSARYSAAADRAANLEALRHREIALAELTAAVAEEQPVALLIDDVHWADTASRQLLGSLVGKLGGQRILAVTTARPTPEGALTVAGTESLTLSPLSEEETGALLASLGALPAAAWADGLAREINAATRGSPLLILETLRLALDQGWLELHDGARACPDPARLAGELKRGGALRRRIEELPRPEGRLLLLLAVAGTPVRAGVLAAAAGRDVESALGDLWEMELRGLVIRKGDERAPAHDEIAALTLETADPDALRAAHRSVGRVLAQTAGDEADLLYRAARHLAQAGDETRLGQAFARWLTLVRRRGDRRPLRILAAELLGSSADAADVRRLLASLPVPLRLGLSSKRQVAAAVGVAGTVGVAAVAVLALLLATPPPAPPDAVLVAVVPSDSAAANVYRVPIYRAGWEALATLDVRACGERRAELSKLARVQMPVFSPDGKSWLFGRIMPDSGERDLFLATADGAERRLTNGPGDDGDPSWSPDGRRFVFETVRWNPRHRCDLAIHDVETMEVRALTRNDHADLDPRWSPDGTRIAFIREFYEMRPWELCWVSVDARTERCTPTSREYAPTGLLAWYDQEQVLAVLDSAGQRMLARVHLESGTVRVIDRRQARGPLATDGQWVACFCEDETTGMAGWLVYPVDRPDQARRVDPGSDAASDLSLLWAPAGRPRTYLQRVDILEAEHAIPLDAAYRLRVQSFDIAGNPISVPVLSWRSGDTTVATVDSTGTLRPRRVGTVTVHVSAGGWREDSARVAIRPPGSTTLLEERWTGELSANWVSFGVPRPVLTTGPEGVPAFWHRGDSTFHSGAYSRRTFDASRGLGVEAAASTPVDALQWQDLVISLDPDLDDAALAAWDHQTGSPPKVGTTLSTCAMHYPGGDGFINLQRVGLSSANITRLLPVEPRLRSGDWYRVRIQIFADGRCGIALDGQPVWRGESRLSLDRPYHVRMEGKSVRTRILVGPLEVWEGVRGDVDWSALDERTQPRTP